MHYYQFNIGDYKSHTMHLSVIEDICYRRLLDHYYLHEKPIENDIEKIARLLMLNGYSKEIEQVLKEFFIFDDGYWVNQRANKEISQYQKFKEDGKRGADIRWGKGGYSHPNETLIANNKHKPLNNNHIHANISMSEKKLLEMAKKLKLSTIGLDKAGLVNKINSNLPVC